MKLRELDEKRCRITDRFGDVFEGVCRHCSRDYVMHEYGFDEEGIMLGAMLLRKSQIKKAELLGSEGPWGGYSGPWGLLEESALEAGPDMVAAVLTWEEDETSIRMMRLLKQDTTGIARDPEVLDALRELSALTESAEAREMAEEMLDSATEG